MKTIVATGHFSGKLVGFGVCERGSERSEVGSSCAAWGERRPLFTLFVIQMIVSQGKGGVSDLLPEQQNLLEKLKPVLKDAGWLEYSEHRDRHAPPQRPEQNPTPTFPFTSHLYLSLQCLLTRHSRDAANAPSRVRGTADRDGTTTAGFKELFSLCGNQGFVTRNHETAVIKKEKTQNKDQHLQWWSSASVPLSNDATVQSQISHSQRVGF